MSTRKRKNVAFVLRHSFVIFHSSFACEAVARGGASSVSLVSFEASSKHVLRGKARDFEAVTGLTKTRSATAGESARGLQWTCFHKGKRESTSASGWLDCLVRRLHLVMHALQISSTWRWSVPQHPPNTFSCFSLLRSSWCWRPNCTGSPSSSSVLSLS